MTTNPTFRQPSEGKNKKSQRKFIQKSTTGKKKAANVKKESPNRYKHNFRAAADKKEGASLGKK